MLNLSALISPLIRAVIAMTLTILLLSSNVLPPAHAAAGDLDPTFGSGGKVVTDIVGGEDIASTVARQSDGKIILGGQVRSENIVGFALARYNTNGSFDSAFGIGGTVFIDFFSGIISIAVQSDDKILIVGAFFDSIKVYTAVRRYSKDGVLDLTFGSGGSVITDIFGNGAAGVAATIQSDGKIIVVGNTVGNNLGDFAVVRYNTNGNLDPGFGSGGKVVTDFGGDENVHAVKSQQDGKIVVVGETVNSVTFFDFALARYNADGSPDQTFGSGGKVTTDFFGNAEQAFDIALQADGKIIAAGRVSSGIQTDFALVRYNTNGSLDPTFGINGKVTTDFFGGLDDARAIIIQPDGKIIAAGTVQTSSVVQNFQFLDFGLAQYNIDGSLDQTFGSNGKVNIDFFGGADICVGAVLQPDGKIVIGGSATSSRGDLDFALARFNGDGPSFDICLQDDSSGSILQINTATGAYQFTNCSGFTISGTGSLTRRGSSIMLQHTASDRRVMAKVDGSTNKATASIQMLSQGLSFTITDRNTANNTCFCR